MFNLIFGSEIFYPFFLINIFDLEFVWSELLFLAGIQKSYLERRAMSPVEYITIGWLEAFSVVRSLLCVGGQRMSVAYG